MNSVPSSNSLGRSVVMVVAVCIGVRIGYEVIAPVFEEVIVVGGLLLLLRLVLRGGVHRR